MAENIQTIGSEGGRDQRGLVTHTVVIDKVRLSNIDTVQPNDNLGLTEVGRTWKQRKDTFYTVYVKLQGATSDATFAPGPDRATYEFIPSFKTLAIEGHPYIEQLIAQYGGKWDKTQSPPRVTFDPNFVAGGGPPSSLANGASGLPGGSSSGGAQSSHNPMAGQDTYDMLSGIFRKRYCVAALPNDLLSRIGKIITQLPNGYPTPAGRNWLTMPVPWSERGNLYDLTEEYQLSLPGGWNPAQVALFIT